MMTADPIDLIEDSDLVWPKKVAKSLKMIRLPEADARYQGLSDRIRRLVGNREDAVVTSARRIEAKADSKLALKRLHETNLGTLAIFELEHPSAAGDLLLLIDTEKQRPTLFAHRVLDTMAAQGSPNSIAAASGLRRVLGRCDQAVIKAEQAEAADIQAIDAIDRAKLDLKLFVRDCELWVHDHTQPDDPARDVLKVKVTRKPKTEEEKAKAREAKKAKQAQQAKQDGAAAVTPAT